MLRSLIRILRASLVQIDTEMAEKYAKQQQPAVIGSKFAFGRYAAGCVSALMGLVTLAFDRLTLKLICSSHLSLGKLRSEFGHAGSLGSRIIRCIVYGTGGQTVGQTKATLTAPVLQAWHNNYGLVLGVV